MVRVMPDTRGRGAGLRERPRPYGGGREPQGDKRSRQTKSRAGRAGCIERCTSGSGRGFWKRTAREEKGKSNAPGKLKRREPIEFYPRGRSPARAGCVWREKTLQYSA